MTSATWCGLWMKPDLDGASGFRSPGATRASGRSRTPSRPDSLPKPAAGSVALLTTPRSEVHSPNRVGRS
jgi:hypothetical protein